MRNGIISALDLRSMGRELKAVLNGAHVQKPSLLTSNSIVFRCSARRDYLPAGLEPPGEGGWVGVDLIQHSGRVLFPLLKSVSDRLNIATVPPNGFIMGLRKHISNARIVSVEQMGTDRILRFHLKKGDRAFMLYMEIFSQGNIILCDDSGIILQALVQREWKHRAIKGGERYVGPPSTLDSFADPLDRLKALYEGRLRGAKRPPTPISFLARDLNLGGEVAEEILHKLGIDKDAKALSEGDIEGIHHQIRDMLRILDKGGVYHYKGEGVRVFSPFKLSIYNGLEITHYNSWLEAGFNNIDDLREMFSDREGSGPDVPKGHTLKTRAGDEVERVSRIIEQQRQALRAMGEEMNTLRSIGDFIYLHYGFFEGLIKAYDSATVADVEKEGSAINGEIRYSDGVYNIRTPEFSFKFDPSQDINANAATYYEKASRLKAKMEGAKRAIAEKEKALGGLKARSDPNSKDRAGEKGVRSGWHIDTKVRWWFERFRWSITPHNRIVALGRDAGSNENLVKRHLSHSDIYLHADIHGAPSCVLKACDLNGQRVEGDITEDVGTAAVLAATYSKAWATGLATIPVYWVRPEQVSKTPESGEFLPKGAFVIRGKKNFVGHVKLEVSLGLVEVRGWHKLMASTHAALEDMAVPSTPIVDLVPGHRPKSEIIREICSIFRLSGSEKDVVGQILPPGGCEIVR